ncbi:ATP-binding protein [Herbidospora yilanensis]|uniref:ATP-binding protein n=1 Tax=Herbidospora yilanensis TaxID=354426 RepID=UPI000783C858|nr:AAA family ATPase [Herbidospora yilanensis]
MAVNLPAETSSFIGRKDELDRLAGLLAESCLVTVTGPPGVGKTRIALRAAADCAESFPDGAWFAELSPEQDANLLASVVARSLGLREQSTRPYEQVLAEYLAGKRLLLVLDTCEHLVGACAALVDGLLDVAPGLRVLATSRVPLDVPSEKILEVAPFARPEPESDDLLGYDAVRLFVERATDRIPGWQAGDSALMAVGRLCRRLDGIPLGIELAAGHLHALSAEELADRLTDPFDLLTAGYRGGPARHRSFRTAVGWSHELCTPRERLLWARLSVFAGSFDEKTAQAVCADDRLPDVGRVLAELVRKSIVVRKGDRHRLLDGIREYGREWLRELGEERVMRTAHLAHYRMMAARLDREWYGPDQLQWADWAEAELAEIRLALDYGISHGGTACLDLVSSCWIIWGALGQMREGRYFVERALAAGPREGSSYARTLWVLGWISLFQGDMGLAERSSRQSLAEARRIGDVEAMGHALVRLGGVRLFSGAPHKVEELMQEARTHLTAAGATDTIDDLVMDGGQAMAFIFLGDLTRAWGVLQDMHTKSRSRGEIWMRAFGDLFRSQLMLARDEVQGADRAGRESLAVKWRLNDVLGVAMGADHLATVTMALGDARSAAWMHGAAERLWLTFGLTAMGSDELAAPRVATAERARLVLGDEGYERAFEEGFAASLEEVRERLS